MNTTLTNIFRTSLERRWNNYEGPRRWAMPMAPVRAGSAHQGLSHHPSRVQAARARPRLGQVGGWGWAGLWGAGDGPSCSIAGAGTDGSGGLGRSSQAWWCPPTINTPRSIFRDPQSIARISWTQTISLSHFQPIPIQIKKLRLNKWQDILGCFTLIFYACPFYQTHEALWAADPREICGFCFTNVAGKACSKYKKARRALGWKDTV